MDDISELKTQREFAKSYTIKPLVVDDVWYILSANWFNKWKSYVNYYLNIDEEDGDDDVGYTQAPGPIDNSELLSNGKLQPNLAVGTDLFFVPKELWTLLCNKYGCVHQTTSEFERIVVNSLFKKPSLDLYPPKLNLINRANNSENFAQTFCLSDTIEDVKKFIRMEKKLPPNLNIILYADPYDDIINTDDSTTLLESSLDGERKVYYEIKEKAMSNGSNGDIQPRFISSRNSSAYPRGVCGLSNLGNTCFMNSALQCISNVPQLTKYLLSDQFDNDLNTKNKLGSGGLVATAFRDLIRNMWNPSQAGGYCIPRELKSYIGKFASQFAGYQQHDAQELMNFLLDFLSEDLNRITTKPYITYEDDNGRPDEIVAAESWINYKKRNDSIIVDLFHGLLKSTVVCPECSRVSVIFDPFALLSLSLNNIQPDLILWPHHCEEKDGDEWLCIKYNPYMHPSYKCADIINYVQNIRPLKPGFQYVVAERASDGSLYILDPNDKTPLKMSSITVFELQEGSIFQVKLQHERITVMKPFLVSTPSSLNFVKPEEMICLVKQHLHNYFGAKIANEALEGAELTNFEDHVHHDDHRVVQISLAKPYSFGNLVRTAPKKSLHLTECLDFFTYTETLSERNPWYCSKCKEHRQASKKFDIWQLPTVLVCHLKRYKTMFRINKNEVLVDCPLENLEIVNLKGEKSVYDLAAISNHMGGMGGGHYTATAKNNGTWYYFDDSSVSIAHQPIVTKNAYILIYIRRNAVNPPVLSNGDTHMMNHNSVDDDIFETSD